MDTFIEKLNLYDLVGYTIPGTVCAVFCGYCFWSEKLKSIICNDIVVEKYHLYLFAGMLIVGYLFGIVITQIADFIYEYIKKSKKIQDGIGYEKIGYSKIEEALSQIHKVDENIQIANVEDVEKYMGYMYAEIQVDKKYSRVHNYASMEMVCKNMSISLMICLVVWTFTHGLSLETIAIVFLICMFFCRWIFFYQRKDFYVVSWFVEKHLGSDYVKEAE